MASGVKHRVKICRLDGIERDRIGEGFLRGEILEKIETPLVWGLDEVDRLFTCDFGSEVFGLIRSWHNARALDPLGPWERLTPESSTTQSESEPRPMTCDASSSREKTWPA